MKKIAIICCYYGKLRVDYKTWLMSCEYNNTIDWIIFTDCNWGKVPPNVKVINISFTDLKEYIQKKFDFKICLERPYKLCDYRPAYGYIFEEYLRQYDFWGYCDFDMIFGNIRKFITEEILNYYDKIYTKGHLSLYKNNLQINELFKSSNGKMYYKDVFTTNINKVFDEEEGIYDIAIKNNCKTYVNYEFIDLCKHVKELINNDYIPLKNYKYQTIIFDKGKTEFTYLNDGKVLKREVAYVHYSSKEFENKGLTSFQLTSKGVRELNDNNYFKYDCYNMFFCIKLKIKFKKFIFKVKRKSNKIRMGIIEKYKK